MAETIEMAKPTLSSTQLALLERLNTGKQARLTDSSYVYIDEEFAAYVKTLLALEKRLLVKLISTSEDYSGNCYQITDKGRALYVELKGKKATVAKAVN